MDGILGGLVAAGREQKKEQTKQTGMLAKIYAVQEEILDTMEADLKFQQDEAKRRRQSEKRSKADKGLSFSQRLRKEKGDEKESKSLMSKIGDFFGSQGLLGAILAGMGMGAGGGFMNAIMTRLFGRGKKGQKGMVTKFLSDIGTSIRSGLGSLNTALRAGVEKMFTGSGVFGPKGFLSKIGTKSLAKGSGVLAALTSGITEYFNTGSYTDALFAGGGAGVGAAGGAILGSFLGPLGTIVGAAIGGFIGDQLGKIIKDQLDKNEFFKGIFDFVDAEFKRMLESFNNLFEAFKGYFAEVGETFRLTGKILSQLGEKIGNFLSGTWDTFTSAIGTVTDYLSGTFEPIIQTIGDILSPIIDPLTELANTIIPPLMEGFKGLGEFLKPFLNPAAAIADGATGIVEGATGVLGSFNNWLRGIAGEEQKKQRGGFVGTVPNQGGNGDRFSTMVAPGSAVINQVAAGMFQSGGLVPVALEQGEIVVPPGGNTSAALAMNSMFPRFQEGGEVKGDSTSAGRTSKDGKDGTAGSTTLDKLNFAMGAKRANAPVGRCVTGSLDTMQINGVPNPAATGMDAGNNPRGAAAQLINSFGWGAAYGSPITLDSPYGNAGSKVISASEYQKLVSEGKIPSGAIVFQTRHSDWNGTSPGSRGYDMAIAQDNGGYLWNGVNAGSMVYGSGTKQAMVLTPGGGGSSGEAPAAAMLSTALSPSGEAKPGGILPSLESMGGEFGTALRGVLGDIMGALGPIFGALGGLLGSGLQGGVNFFDGLLGAPSAPDTPGEASEATETKVPTGSTPGGAFGESALVSALDRAGMTNKKERAMFMSQMAHESGNFRYDEEIHDGSNYEGRKDLGNTQAGDGKKYKGRGYIQLTGRANYRKYGKMVGHDLENNPELAKDANIAADIALAYWKDRGISSPAQNGDIRKVTRIINGGYNGLADREQKYTEYMRKGLQNGGVANMSSSGTYSASMVSKSQETFAQKIADAMSPTIIPVPMGGGGGNGGQQVISQPGNNTGFPSLPSEDNSVMGMEYKYRITMGASV